MGKNLHGWELAKTKANFKPESNMKVVWNTCKKEFGGMKSVSAMKTTKKVNLKTPKGSSILGKLI